MIAENLVPFAISLLIGLFIGIERERSHPAGTQAMGVRTFVLLALLGTLTADINKTAFTVTVSAFVFGGILLSYYRSSKRQGKTRSIGITTEFAGALIYCLGYLTPHKPLLAAIIGVFVLLMLLARDTLHTFSRDTLKTKEIYAATTILVIGLGILPLLPNKTIDPWQLFNPYQFGLIVLILSVIQFTGYITIRITGQKNGMILSGFLGGLVSSTAVFTSLPEVSKKHPKLIRQTVAAALFAKIAMLITASIVIYLISKPLALSMAPTMLAMMLVGSTSFLLIYKRNPGKQMTSNPHNPLDFSSVLKLAFFIASILIIVALAKRYLGTEGVNIVSLLGGLFEIHSTVFANSTLFAHSNLDLSEARNAIAFAILASYVSKFFLLWTLARNRFAFITSLYLALMIAAGAIVFFVT